MLGFQGGSQLEKRYGQDAEAMLSQPATKIFFKTSEPRAAKWISDTLGEIEVERIKESRSIAEPRIGLLGGKRQKSYSMEIANKPLIMASEIAGLEPLRAYIKQENRVVPVKFALAKRRSREPEFIERKMIVPEPKELSVPAKPTKPALASALSSTPDQLALATPKAGPRMEEKLEQQAPVEVAKSPFGRKQGSVGETPKP